MHEYLKQAREGAAKKLKDIQSGEPHTKVDSSSWSPPEMLEADKQTGMRPVSPRQYKSGGKVHGVHAKKRADRKARKEGGRAMSVDGYINRDNKMANDERKGVKHVGGMKRGGKIKREHHADGDAVGDLIRQDQIEQGMKGRGLPERIPLPPRRPANMDKTLPYRGPMPTSNPNSGYKKGGKAEHPDVAEDKALIKKMVKPSAMRRDEHCWGGEAKSKKAEGGSTKWIQGAIKHPGSLHKALHVPAGEKIPAKKLEKAAHSDNPKLAKKANLAKTLKRMHHADGGEAGRGLYVRQGYPHEVPGADGGRTAKKGGGSLSKGKGKTNVNIMIHPHSSMSPVPMAPTGPAIPPPPPRPQMPSMPPQGLPMGAPPMMPPMGAARPGMPPIGRKSGGKVEHVIDHAAGGGLGRLEKIKAYGLE